jgi:type II secretory pathway component PulF
MLAAADYFPAIVRRRLRGVNRQLLQGDRLAAALQDNGLLPASMAGLVQAAERMHNLPWALGEMGESMGERTIRRLRRLSQVVAPLMVMGVGVLVAVEVLGIFMPIVDIVTRLAD